MNSATTLRSTLSRRQWMAAAAMAACPPLAAARRQPNIVLILADDLGYNGLGCFGNSRIRTPHLDSLARGGVRFTDFHSSGAVCSPTRAGLMTGRYQQRCGIDGVLTAAGHRDQGLALSEITFPSLLKKGGYATGIFGKWHLGYDPEFNPTRHGFDVFRGYVSGNVDYFSHIDQTGVPDWWDGVKRITEEGYTTELITRHALNFIDASKDRPFFCYLAHEAPHSPYQGPNDKPVRAPGKPNAWPERTDYTKAHDEMVAAMDDSTGHVMRALQQHRLERDTLIFFFSDNGGVRQVEAANGVLRGQKGTVWEGGHRVPALAYWPGHIAPGQQRNETAIGLDLFPTFLEVAGVPLPKRKLDGRSLRSLLLERRPPVARPLFWQHGTQLAMRDGKWKLVVDRRSGQPGGLFDLEADSGESNDLSARESARLNSMQQALAAWEKDVSGGKVGRV